uniref:Endonuclease V n=1 Tax=Thermodesulfovibrio aggregans TaxID=86166 RepID=A0A7C4AIQ1_9BACT
MKLWVKSVQEAKKIQMYLRKRLKIVPLFFFPNYICGVDAAFTKYFVFACASLFQFSDLIPVEDRLIKMKIEFPYVPNFLSFREGKAIIEAIKSLKIKPDVILFDGQGIAHPLSFGIASHIGVLLDIPSIGCAKSKLIGKYKEPAKKRGSFSYLYYYGKIIGAVLRTKDKVKPVFVSPGHLIDLPSSIEIVLKSTIYRIPEPLRRAHHMATVSRNEYLKSLSKIPV